MAEPAPVCKDQDFVSLLQHSAQDLVKVLQNDEYENASKIIHDLLEARDKHIFNSVGQLTRGLHNAIVNFNVDADLSKTPVDIKSSEISDASDRLNYVIELTQAAADKTMDKVDVVAPIAMRLGEEAHKLKQDWKKLKSREIDKDSFKQLYARIDSFLETMDQDTSELNKNLQEIILEQGYQDLTGQVLRKVIALVKDVESELVNLMRIAGQVEQVTGLTVDENIGDSLKDAGATTRDIIGEGPIIKPENRNDVVTGQDDVDDLLSSLGF